MSISCSSVSPLSPSLFSLKRSSVPNLRMAFSSSLSKGVVLTEGIRKLIFTHVHGRIRKNLRSSWDSNPGLSKSSRMLLPLSY